jgi:SAM-dependent methyltransferase
MTAFSDHFSACAAEYAQCRPSYPEKLFAFLSSQAPGRRLCWDCATGNGQAAVALAEWFDQVIATDASQQQLERSIPHPSVAYRRATAESSTLPSASVDLVTVAAAVHWFDLDAFYAEVRRVARAEAVVACWSYGPNPSINAPVDAIVRQLAEEILGAYWPPELAQNRARYARLPFPFAEIDAPRFEARVLWGLDAFAGHLRSWSAVGPYSRATGDDPVQRVWPALEQAWGPETRQVSWDLHLRVGRV